MLYSIILILLLFIDEFSFEKGPKFVTFNNGQKYPIIGLGTWQTKSEINDNQKAEIYEAVKTAIKIGYRHIDCASIYNNEKYVGEAIAEQIKLGVVKREELYVTSKLWNNKHNPKEVEGELKKSLRLLQLDYLDLYLIHWPFACTDDPLNSRGHLTGANYSYLSTWRAMEKCARSGLTKSIGISNFNIKQVKYLLKAAKIKPVVNQVENHPYLTQTELKEFCESNGILLTAYGPLGSPYRKTNSKNLLDEPIVKQLAYKYRKSTAQILIKFQVQRGIMVIPKSVDPERLIENFDIWNFEMSKKEINLLESLNQNLRFVPFKIAINLRNYPF